MTTAMHLDRVALARGFCVGLALGAYGVSACEIKLAYNDISAPPYYYGDAGKTPKDPGPAIELVDLAANKLGCKIQWARMPLKRILRDLERGATDATLALSYNADRARFAAYPMKGATPDSSMALWTLSYDFYVKSGSGLHWDGRQFNRASVRVGANAGYSVIQDLAALGIRVEEAPGDVNNLNKLLKDRIDAYAGQSFSIDRLREQTDYLGIEKLAPSIARKDYFLVFSSAYYAASRDTAEKLWKMIAEVRKSHGDALDKKYKAHSESTH